MGLDEMGKRIGSHWFLHSIASGVLHAFYRV